MPKSKGGKQGGNFLCSPGYYGLRLSYSNNITQNLADIDAPETLTRAPVPKKPTGWQTSSVSTVRKGTRLIVAIYSCRNQNVDLVAVKHKVSCIESINSLPTGSCFLWMSKENFTSLWVHTALKSMHKDSCDIEPDRMFVSWINWGYVTRHLPEFSYKNTAYLTNVFLKLLTNNLW